MGRGRGSKRHSKATKKQKALQKIMLQPAATPVRTAAVPQTQAKSGSQTEVKSGEESPSVSSPSSSSSSAADVSTSDKSSGHHEHSRHDHIEQVQNLMTEIRHLQKYGTRRTRRYLNKMHFVDDPTKEDIEKMISIYNKAAKIDKNFMKRRALVELTSSSECCDFCSIRKHQQTRSEEARSRLQRVQRMREQMQEAKQSEKSTKSTPSSPSTGRGSTATAAKSATNKERPKDQRRPEVSNGKTTKNEPRNTPLTTRKAAPSKPAAAEATAAQPPVDQHDVREISPGEVIEDLDCRCERCRGKTDAPSKQPVPATESTSRSSSSTEKRLNSAPSKGAVKDPEASKKEEEEVKQPTLPAPLPKPEGAKRPVSAPASSTKQGRMAVKTSENSPPKKDTSSNVKKPAASAPPSKATAARPPVARQPKAQTSSSSVKPQNSTSAKSTTKAAEVAKKDRIKEKKQRPSSTEEVTEISSSKPSGSGLNEDSSDRRALKAPATAPSSSLQTTATSTQNDASDMQQAQSWTEYYGKKWDTLEKAVSELGLGGLRSDGRTSVPWKDYLKKGKALLKKLDREAFFESMEQLESERALCHECLVEEMAKYGMQPILLPPQYNFLYSSPMKHGNQGDATRFAVGAEQHAPDVPCARHAASTGPKQDASACIDLEADAMDHITATDTDDSGEDLSGMYFYRNCDINYRSSRPFRAYVRLRVAQAKAYDGNLEEEMKKQLEQRRAALDHKANAFL